MDIRPLDDAALADDAVLREWHDLCFRAEQHGRAGMPFWTFREFLGAYRSPDSGERHEMFAAYDGDRMVGNVVVWFPLADNTEKAYINLDVDVPCRRRGIGRALLARAEEAARADDRSVLLISAHVP